jgi:hypothetical protein
LNDGITFRKFVPLICIAFLACEAKKFESEKLL